MMPHDATHFFFYSSSFVLERSELISPHWQVFERVSIKDLFRWFIFGAAFNVCLHMTVSLLLLEQQCLTRTKWNVSVSVSSGSLLVSSA